MASQASHDIWILECLNSHFAVFLETGTTMGPGSGYIYHLYPTSTSFTFRYEPARRPETSFQYMSKKFCGRVPVGSFDKVRSVCKRTEIGGSEEDWCERVVKTLETEKVLVGLDWREYPEYARRS